MFSKWLIQLMTNIRKRQSFVLKHVIRRGKLKYLVTAVNIYGKGKRKTTKEDF